MALKNGSLSAASKAKGDKITTSIYDDLVKLLANDNGLDVDIQDTFSKQPTIINCMNGCALGCANGCSSTCGNSCTGSCGGGCSGACRGACAGSCERACENDCYGGCDAGCQVAP